MITWAGTGHRLDKLGGYNTATTNKVNRFALAQLAAGKPDYIISGMAQGWDMAIAQAACILGIPWTAAIPFRGQESKWPYEAREIYKGLLAKATKVEYLFPQPGYNWMYQKRNEWMVDHCDMVLALWDGSDGGTANCANYAFAIHKPVFNTWPRWLDFKA